MCGRWYYTVYQNKNMKALIMGKFALVWLPSLEIEQGVYEYYVLPTLLFTNNKSKSFRSLTLHWLKWAVISVIKTV